MLKAWIWRVGRAGKLGEGLGVGAQTEEGAILVNCHELFALVWEWGGLTHFSLKRDYM